MYCFWKVRIWDKDDKVSSWSNPATIYIPAEDVKNIRESGHVATDSEGVEFLRMEDGAAVYKVGSGEYVFLSV